LSNFELCISYKRFEFDVENVIPELKRRATTDNLAELYADTLKKLEEDVKSKFLVLMKNLTEEKDNASLFSF